MLSKKRAVMSSRPAVCLHVAAPKPLNAFRLKSGENITLRPILHEGIISIYVGEISGSVGDKYEDGCLLGCCAL
jgi:hypothetical protein